MGGGNLTPWLVLSSTAYPTLIGNNFTSNIVVDLQHDNGILTDPTHPELYYHNPTMGHVLNGIHVNFSTSLGTIGFYPLWLMELHNLPCMGELSLAWPLF